MPSYYVDEDYPAGPEIQLPSLNEAINTAQNRPLWRLMFAFGARHSWWCMPEIHRDRKKMAPLNMSE